MAVSYTEHDMTHPSLYTTIHTPQQEEDIKGVKKMVGKGCPGGVRREGITLEGFWEVVRLFLFNMQVGGWVGWYVWVV